MKPEEEELYSDDSDSDNGSQSENEVDDENEEPENDEQYDDADVEEPGEEHEDDDDKSVDEDKDEDDESDNEYNPTTIPQIGGTNDDDEDDEDDEDTNTPYLQKFNSEINKNYIVDFHPECTVNNYDEISALSRVIRDKNNNIVDDLHKSIPFLTKYERTRIIGQRAKQINSGAKAFVKVPENVIDGYLIAELELAQKRIPFIIRRPLPGGGCEYWNLKDLEIVSF